MKKQQAYMKRKLIKLGKEFEQRDKIIMEPALQHIRMKVKMTKYSKAYRKKGMGKARTQKQNKGRANKAQKEKDR